MMKKIWLVVADSARAKVYEMRTPEELGEELEDFAHTRSRLPQREIESDAPGRSFDRSGPGRHAMEGTNANSLEAEKFAAMLAKRLADGRRQADFEELFLVAPPRFLGMLRGHLDEPTKGCVAREIRKNLVTQSRITLAGCLREGR